MKIARKILIEKPPETEREELLHLHHVLERKREIELQRIDNEIQEEEVKLPQYVRPKREPLSAGIYNFVKQVLP